MQDEPPITNYEEVEDVLESQDHMLPDGEYQGVRVVNPSLHDGANPPDILRVYTHRKASNWDLIQEARSLGLRVADVWQFDRHQDDDEVALKLEPDERRPADVVAFLDDFYHNAVEDEQYQLAAQVHTTIAAVRNKHGLESNDE